MTTAKLKDDLNEVTYQAMEIGVVEAMAFSIAFSLAEAVTEGVLTPAQKTKIANRTDEFLKAMQLGNVVTSTGEGHYKIISRDQVVKSDQDDNLIIGGK